MTVRADQPEAQGLPPGVCQLARMHDPPLGIAQAIAKI